MTEDSLPGERDGNTDRTIRIFRDISAPVEELMPDASSHCTTRAGRQTQQTNETNRTNKQKAASETRTSPLRNEEKRPALCAGLFRERTRVAVAGRRFYQQPKLVYFPVVSTGKGPGPPNMHSFTYEILNGDATEGRVHAGIRLPALEASQPRGLA